MHVIISSHFKAHTSQRWLQKQNPIGPENTLCHTVASPGAGQGVLNGIDLLRLKPSSRFGKAFYLSEVPDITLAELAHHNATGVVTIRFNFDSKGAKILDLINPRIVRAWGYKHFIAVAIILCILQMVN